MAANPGHKPVCSYQELYCLDDDFSFLFNKLSYFMLPCFICGILHAVFVITQFKRTALGNAVIFSVTR